VRDFRALMGDQRANHARLKSAAEFGRAEMGEGSELHQSVLRAVLYALMELQNNLDGEEVLAHLTLNIPNYYGDMTQRELAIELADYLARPTRRTAPRRSQRRASAAGPGKAPAAGVRVG
jgi:putative DNA methylase